MDVESSAQGWAHSALAETCPRAEPQMCHTPSEYEVINDYVID